MPLPHPAVPHVPAARRLRRAIVLTSAALCLGAVPASTASAATAGGAEAGDAAVLRAAAATTPSARTSRVTIRAVQRRLGVTVDGAYGTRTRRAVRRFQHRRGLRADGRLTPRTLGALGVVGRAAEASPAGAATGLLAAIAACESGGDPAAVSANGRFRGKYQFLTSTWEALGGTGDPAAAPEAEQDRRAAALLAAEGTKPWPVCGPRANAAR